MEYLPLQKWNFLWRTLGTLGTSLPRIPPPLQTGTSHSGQGTSLNLCSYRKRTFPEPGAPGGYGEYCGSSCLSPRVINDTLTAVELVPTLVQDTCVLVWVRQPWCKPVCGGQWPIQEISKRRLQCSFLWNIKCIRDKIMNCLFLCHLFFLFLSMKYYGLERPVFPPPIQWYIHVYRNRVQWQEIPDLDRKRK